ncbi:type II asparaginase [Helicobacter bizzozeronii]|uniref:type II asparaginase n=1 Tax=Helicobacter bizzozeronii TaxID=56877 RepID=UPI000CF0252D|nr:type II asparaginase [Helicobacter bizzozeronii]
MWRTWLVWVFLAGSLVAKPTIYLLATGGTIAGSSKSALSGAYKAGQLGVEALIEAIPQLKNQVHLKGEQVSNIGSQEMDNATWLKLARRVSALLKRSDVDGIVITHGTDTLEESAYFLDLVIKSNKPIVLVGAMRHAGSLSADGPLNLYNAIHVAMSPQARGKGVLVVMDDAIHAAREASKMNTTRTDAFQSPNTGKIGMVLYGQVHFYMQSLRRHTLQSAFDIDKIQSLPRVDILYAHPNDHPDLVQDLIQHGSKGIIYAGMGNGNLYPSVLKALSLAVQKGVVVVRSSRVPSGMISVPGEVDDVKYGFLSGDDLNAPKARVLLMLALSQTHDPKKIQEYFFTH